MPIYEYHCEHCDHHSEILQGINDAALMHCEQCQQDTLKRLVSASGFRLKGGGWYETDFKNPAKVEAKTSVTTENKTTDNKTVDNKKNVDNSSSSE